MENESSRSLWPFGLAAIMVVALYVFLSVEVRPDRNNARPSGGLSEIEALADRDDTNIVFILVDTLRAERMGAYGYERDTTPFLSELASKGLLFKRHIAQSSWTKTSMASMWSSLSPIRSGVTKFDETVSSEILMPAEILSDLGFKTVGLYRNGWVSGYFGFDQGFEKYYRPPAASGRLKKEALRSRPNAGARGTDEDVIADGIEFLRIHGKSSRFLLYLHLMDLHEYTYDSESAIFGQGIADIYDNSILRTDWVLSTLYDYMVSRDLLKNTIFVVLSDHGEAFGERGFEGHARSVFPETTETPLIISLPFALEEGVVVSDKTTNMDVWPTLLDLIGEGDQIAPEVDGRSRKREIIAAASGVSAEVVPDDFSVAFLDENWGRPSSERRPAISVLEGEYRFLSGSSAAGRPFEVLLSTEDRQSRNLIEEYPEIADRLRKRADLYLEDEPLYSADIIELDEMQLDQLRALGYKLP